MTFQNDKTDEFISLFEERKSTIRNFDGCMHLELWQDSTDERIFFTYSHWVSESALNHYRFSEFFKDTWGKTKALFAEKPNAWSVTMRSEA